MLLKFYTFSKNMIMSMKFSLQFFNKLSKRVKIPEKNDQIILVWFICNNWPEKYFNLLSKTDWNKTTFFRYDCRGHLYKLDDFDFPNNPGIKSSKLSTEEMDIESILDEERYLDLNLDTTEDEILEGSVTRKFLLLSISYVLYLLFLCLLVSVNSKMILNFWLI